MGEGEAAEVQVDNDIGGYVVGLSVIQRTDTSFIATGNRRSRISRTDFHFLPFLGIARARSIRNDVLVPQISRSIRLPTTCVCVCVSLKSWRVTGHGKERNNLINNYIILYFIPFEKIFRWSPNNKIF